MSANTITTMSRAIPPAALAQIREAERAARNGIEDTKRKIETVDAAILKVKLEAQGCFAEYQNENDALAEKTLALAQAILNGNKRMKERLEAEKEQYGYQAAFLRGFGKSSWKTWDKLTDDHKWKKANLLVLIYTQIYTNRYDRIERLWIEGHVPANLEGDKDLLLARLLREDFHGLYYKYINRNAALFSIPEPLTTDKEVVHAAVFRYPEILKQDGISEVLLDDDDVFSAFIQSPRWKKRVNVPYGHVHNYTGYAAGCDKKTHAGLIAKFSARIRGSSSLMLDAAKLTSFAFCCLEGELRGDPKFYLRLIDYIEPGQPAGNPKQLRNLQNDTLEHVPDSVRSNPDVVRAIVSKNGLCLQGASSKQRGSEEIIRAACDQCAYAFFYCDPTSPTKSKLLADKDFMLQVMSNVSLDSLSKYGVLLSEEDKLLYKMLPSVLQLDRDIICAAKTSGFLSTLADLPESLADDHNFWQEMIEKNSSFLFILPRKFETDDTFARAVKDFRDIATVELVFGRFPALSDDEDIWRTIINGDGSHQPNWVSVPKAIELFAPLHIQQHRALMLRASTRSMHVFLHLPLHFQEDRQFAETYFEKGPGDTPARVQRLHPDLFVSLMQRAPYDEEYLPEDIAPDLWIYADRAILKVFLARANERFDDLPDTIKNDETCGLLAAELLNDEDDFEEVVSATLRRNSSFMTKAVRLNPMLFLQAVGPLRRDPDLALLAVSDEEKGQELVEQVVADFDNAETDDDYDETVFPTPLPDASFLREVWHEAKENLSTFDAYFAGILCGLSPLAGDGCAFAALLAKDQETTAALKRKFADLMGAPTGAELGMLRRAVKNLDSVLAQEALWDE